MEFFMSLDAIAKAKSEIFEHMGPSGVAVLNADSPQFDIMKEAAHKQEIGSIITFGKNEKADCRLLDYQTAKEGCAVKTTINGKKLDYTLKAVGRHWAMTSLLVLAVMNVLGLDREKTAKALAEFGELEGRGHTVLLPLKDGVAVLVDDSYNASPAAMKAAFEKTAEIWEQRGKKGRKLAALGNMLELGKDSKALHEGLATDIATYAFDGVYTAGDLMAHLRDALSKDKQAGHVAHAMELLPLLEKNLCPGDVLLVKGSHGSKMYELARALREKTLPKEAA
jgi:UDP-N-acetylmuramoyl-tripeptide--D-alanyl-D-alanine ligase